MNNASAFSIGQLAGSVVGVFFLYAVWEYLLFKRIFDDPVRGKAASVVAAWLTASILYGFVSTNGGPFNPSGFLTYMVGAAVVGFFAIRRGMQLREKIAADESVGDTFT